MGHGRADLIVLARPARSPLRALFSQGHTARIVRDAPSDVLLVPLPHPTAGLG